MSTGCPLPCHREPVSDRVAPAALLAPDALALVAVAGEAGAALLEPWPLKIVLDNLLQHRALPGWLAPAAAWIGGGSLAILNVAVVAVAAIAVAGALSSYLNTWLTTTVGQGVMHDLRRTLYHHIHRLSLAEHDEKRTGDLIGRVTKDIESVQDFVTSALLGIVTNVLTLAGIVTVMLYLNWRFTLISLSVAPVLFLVVYAFTRRIKSASRDVRKKESELVSMVAEVFSSIRVVKAFAREDYEEQRFERQSLENVETALRARNIKMLLSPAVEVIVAAGTCLMLVVRRAAGPGGRADRRGAGRLPALPREDVQADARPVEDERHGVEGGRGLRADPRGPGDRKRRARPAERPHRGPVQGHDRVRRRVVRLQPRRADSRRRQLHHRTRAGRGVRRPDRRRQDDHHQSRRSFLRSDRRHRVGSTARTSGA